VSASETKSPYKVQVLDRSFAILNALASAGRDASLVEVAGMVKLHKSTVHRLLMILVAASVSRAAQDLSKECGFRGSRKAEPFALVSR
jgi:hypothetical protein